jgi:hypothetical protein
MRLLVFYIRVHRLICMLNLVYVNGLVYVKGFKGRSCIEIEVMEGHWARKLEVHVHVLDGAKLVEAFIL